MRRQAHDTTAVVSPGLTQSPGVSPGRINAHPIQDNIFRLANQVSSSRSYAGASATFRMTQFGWFPQITTMLRKVAIIDAHPDPAPARYVHALAGAYASGAQEAGHKVRTVTLGALDVPILRTREEWTADKPAATIVQPGQEAIRWADHLVFFYSLWLGDMPGLLKAWLEQVMRPSFALDSGGGKFPKKMLEGRSARVIVTMGMPAFSTAPIMERTARAASSATSLVATGIEPVSSSLIGNVEGSEAHRNRWLERMHAYGVEGA